MKFTSTEATPAPHVPPGVLRLTGAAKEDIPMYRIQTMNKISPVGLNRFPSELYEVGDAVQDPQGILVRSAKLLDLEFNPGLLAIARAGVGSTIFLWTAAQRRVSRCFPPPAPTPTP